MDNKPKRVRIMAVTAKTTIIQKETEKMSLFIRNSYTAIATPKNNVGSKVYRPNRIASSVRKFNTSEAARLSMGMMIAAKIPKVMPIRYLIQSFIVQAYNMERL